MLHNVITNYCYISIFISVNIHSSQLTETYTDADGVYCCAVRNFLSDFHILWYWNNAKNSWARLSSEQLQLVN